MTSQQMTTTSVSSSMSSRFIVPQTFSDPYPEATPTSGPGNGGRSGGRGPEQGLGSNTSASIYLYTFLGTLIVLLTISVVIIIRSFRIRRMHRRMVEEAIRNGTYVPPELERARNRVDLSKKPTMWEAWLGGGYIGPKSKKISGIEEKTHPLQEPANASNAAVVPGWAGVMPMSIQVLKTPPSSDAEATRELGERPSTPPRDTSFFHYLAHCARRLNPFARTRSPEPLLPTSVPASPLPDLDTRPVPALANVTPDDPATLRVSLLIAMPSPHPFPLPKPGDVELPTVEVGSLEIDVHGEKKDQAEGSSKDHREV